jgi:hypothetical protein
MQRELRYDFPELEIGFENNLWNSSVWNQKEDSLSILEAF